MGNAHSSTPNPDPPPRAAKKPYFLRLVPTSSLPIPIPKTPFPLLHRTRTTTYTTTTTLHSLGLVSNVIAALKDMLSAHRLLFADRNPQMRARFERLLRDAETFYHVRAEECVRYNPATGWYDVEHGAVVRGAERVMGEFTALMEEFNAVLGEGERSRVGLGAFYSSERT